MKCRISKCRRKAERRGFCNIHYRRILRHGDPNTVLPSHRPSNVMAWITANSHHSGDECLTWPFSRRSRDGKPHMMGNLIPCRVMCEMVHGAPPSPKHQAAHSCGMAHKGCINPRHLSWKTPKENCADRILHGTQVRGSAIPWSKLTDHDVASIRALSESNTQYELASIFGVSQSNISNILRRKSWTHLP